MTWDGDEYQARFDALAAKGAAVHGEVDFVMSFEPGSVLDAGCGSGRVAGELVRRGVEAVGVDSDQSMIATARTRAPAVTWVLHDLASLDLGRVFDLVVMAGNVPLFTPPGTQPDLVAGCARHVRAGGLLVAGFQLDRGYGLDQYDADCASVGLEVVERWATWDRQPFSADGNYAVSAHREAVQN